MGNLFPFLVVLAAAASLAHAGVSNIDILQFILCS